MTRLTRRSALFLSVAALAGCATGGARDKPRRRRALHHNETPELRALIERHAAQHEVPVALVHRVIRRESRHRPDARNGPYRGLMQIHPQTARTMGYRGSPEGLQDADTNLRYAVKYLRGAWLLSNGSHDRAVQWYARGYYYEARRRGMLRETGLQ